MENADLISRAYSSLLSLKKNIPETFAVEEKWVNNFNSEIEKLEISLAIDLKSFKVPDSDLIKSVAAYNYVTGETDYRPGRWCEKSRLLLKLDAVLNYFAILNAPKGTKIGFQS